jgi:hypothetical protein
LKRNKGERGQFAPRKPTIMTANSIADMLFQQPPVRPNLMVAARRLELRTLRI